MMVDRRYDEPRLHLGVSACPLRKPARIAGGDKRDTFVTEALARFVEWVPVCPEDSALNLDGFVLTKDSTSCGRFPQAFSNARPMLPVEEEGRLCDPVFRENFIERVYAARRVRRLLENPTRIGDLVRFHTRHKLQLLAHSPARYTELGRLVAHARAPAPQRVMAGYGRAFTTALETIVTRARHVNVLQHAAGYFRRVLSAAACRDLATAIVDYQRGLTPLVVPLRMIDDYARLRDVRYLCDQTYLNPYPHELMLRTISDAVASHA